MNKYLYCKTVKSSPNKLYEELYLDEQDKEFLQKNNIYHVPSADENGKFMVGMFQLRALLAM